MARGAKTGRDRASVSLGRCKSAVGTTGIAFKSYLAQYAQSYPCGILESLAVWRNWQTQQTQNLPELCSVKVRFLSPPPNSLEKSAFLIVTSCCQSRKKLCYTMTHGDTSGRYGNGQKAAKNAKIPDLDWD